MKGPVPCCALTVPPPLNTQWAGPEFAYGLPSTPRRQRYCLYVSPCLPKPRPKPKQNRLLEIFMGRRGERRKGRRMRAKKGGGREGGRREGAEGLSGLILYDSTKLNSKAIHTTQNSKAKHHGGSKGM